MRRNGQDVQNGNQQNEANRYALEATDNSKAGPAFALPPESTCDCATDTCSRVCYKKLFTYNSDGSIEKRARNLRTVERLLALGGPELLAQALVELIDEYKPKDWFIAKTTMTRTARPWTFRIHDLGDFYRTDYIQAWTLAVAQRPECLFWFYTRAFVIKDRFDLMTELAAQPNCQGWISIDADNWMSGITAYRVTMPGVWKLALLQTEDLPEGLLSAITKVSKQTDVINFPVHNGPHHIQPLTGQPVMNCPQILGAFPLQRGRESLRPCPRCSICLPA
ncbi:MAG: hypothetical protein K2X29_01505 [Candidatus Obscuribacterales bacterium]|nr:hypothetical protein [Candidatus Obscuribacterales bacterium]